MPSFKPKTSKNIQINNKGSITLDGKHNDILNEFYKNEELIIPELKREIKILKKQKKEEPLICEKLEIEDHIIQKRELIKKLKYEKKNYFLNNSQYIFDYFENKQIVADGQNSIKILDNFFKIKTEQSQDEESRNIQCNNDVQKYLMNIDNTYLDIKNIVKSTDICQSCFNGELIPVEYDGILICNSCSEQFPYLVENEKPSYKEPPKEVCFYAYKRINHFREILAQLQAKETTQIPDEVIENIKNQIKRERYEIEDITNKQAKEILKKLEYNKYYEHIPFIKEKLGVKPPVMSQELEETLCNLFMDIQAPYAKFCPDDRVNFLNYYYTVYKLCELLGQKQFLAYFPMLKDREKRIEQDEIWKKICGELNWEFIPTV